MQNNLVETFKKELNLTDARLAELAELKKGLVIDVKTDAGFKLARKERSEQSKILSRIDRVAIDGKKSMDDARHELKAAVSAIYAPIVTAFEAENEIRKEAEEKKKAAEEARINGIRNEISGIRQFSKGLHGKSSGELQEIIEAVDLIDISANFAELTQEAMQAKDEALGELNATLAVAIQQEQLAADREKMRIEKKEQEEKARKVKAIEGINNLINEVKMTPIDAIGKSSGDIERLILHVKALKIEPEFFGDCYEDALITKSTATTQLEVMHKSELQAESHREYLKAKAKKEQDKAQAEETAKRDKEDADRLALAEEQAVKEPITPVESENNTVIDDTEGAGYGDDFVETESGNSSQADIGTPVCMRSELAIAKYTGLDIAIEVVAAIVRGEIPGITTKKED